MALEGLGTEPTTQVDSVLVFQTGGVGGQLDNIFDGEGIVRPDGFAINGKLVGGGYHRSRGRGCC